MINLSGLLALYTLARNVKIQKENERRAKKARTQRPAVQSLRPRGSQTSGFNRNSAPIALQWKPSPRDDPSFDRITPGGGRRSSGGGGRRSGGKGGGTSRSPLEQLNMFESQLKAQVRATKEMDENRFHLLTGAPRAGLGSPGYSGIIKGGGGTGSLTFSGSRSGDRTADQTSYLSGQLDTTYDRYENQYDPTYESYADLTFSGGR